MCLNNKIVATNCSENTKQLKIRLPFFVKTKVIRTYSFLLFLLSRKMHGIQRTVPEDICKPEYICIIYWLFISVHILLVQTQTVLEVLRPQGTYTPELWTQVVCQAFWKDRFTHGYGELLGRLRQILQNTQNGESQV